MEPSSSEIRLYTYRELFEKVKSVIRIHSADVRTVLDVPAGGGALTRFLAEDMGLEVKASDIDSAKWEYPDTPCVPADLGNSLPFPDASFDMVVCMEGLKHVTDLSTAISEVARVLKPEGVFIATFSNDLALQVRLRFLFTGYSDADRKNPQELGSEDHRSFLFVRSLVHLPYLYYFLEREGIEIVKTETSRYRVFSVILAVLLYLPVYLFTRQAVGSGHPLFRELVSLKWLAGRHNIIVCRKGRRPQEIAATRG